MFTAKKAKELATSTELNYQRNYVLNEIRYAANFGNKFIVISNPQIKLFEDDYIFFEKLGYKVKRESKIIKDEKCWTYFPIISW